MEERSEYPPYRWVILSSECLAIMAVYMDMIAIAPIIGELAANLRIGMGTATNLMMGFVLSAACVLIWGGVVVDKSGITVATCLGLLCAALPASLMPIIGQNYGVVMLARLVQGASIGFLLATIGPVAVLWFPPKERGLAGGIIIAFISVGSALGGLVSPMILSSGVSWQGTLCIMSLLGWVSILFTLIVARRPPSSAKADGVVRQGQPGASQLTLSKAFRLPMTWIGALVVFFNTWNLYCFLNFVPAYAAVPPPMGIGLGPVQAGRMALAGTIIGIVSTILGGWVFDKLAKGNQRPAVLGGFALTGLFAFPLTLASVCGSLPLFVICLMLVGWGVNFMGASFNGFIAANYPPSIVGRMVGWWFGFGAFGGALGLYVGGKTIDATGTFKGAIALVSASAIIGFALDCFLKPANRNGTQ